MMRFRRHLLLVGTMLTASLALTACSDGETAATPAAETGSAPAGSEGATDAPETVTVTGRDYAFDDVPETVPAGTELVLDNASDAEVHEVLAFRVKDDEDRPAAELLGLEEAELMQAVEMRGVAMAPPGGTSTDVTPPLVLEQPGRYLLVCLLPTNGPVDEVLDAAEEFMRSGATEGAPDYPDSGPPHVVNGMSAEMTVTAG